MARVSRARAKRASLLGLGNCKVGECGARDLKKNSGIAIDLDIDVHVQHTSS